MSFQQDKKKSPRCTGCGENCLLGSSLEIRWDHFVIAPTIDGEAIYTYYGSDGKEHDVCAPLIATKSAKTGDLTKLYEEFKAAQEKAQQIATLCKHYQAR